VGALLVEDERGTAPPVRASDVEVIQLFIGVRYLLLAPLYGYSLRRLTIEPAEGVHLTVLRDGLEERHELDAFRFRIRALVREELDRLAAGSRGAIDLSKVTEAEAAAQRQDWPRVAQLLGSWPAPLAIFLRTPEGQGLTPEARALISKGLGLLGSACVEMGDLDQAEEVLRIGIQYAVEGVAAADLFLRLGLALLRAGRSGEAIAPLRRALAFGGAPTEVLPPLGRAFRDRKKWVAAYACLRGAVEAGVSEIDLAEDLRSVEAELGVRLTGWKAMQPIH
jgi:hypothetical protein